MLSKYHEVKHDSVILGRAFASVVFFNRFGRIFASLQSLFSNRFGRKVDVPSSSELRSPVLGFSRCLAVGSRVLVLGSWSLVWGSSLVLGSGFLVLAAGFVPGSWFMVLGFWFEVPGYFLFPVLGPWFVVPGPGRKQRSLPRTRARR